MTEGQVNNICLLLVKLPKYELIHRMSSVKKIMKQWDSELL